MRKLYILGAIACIFTACRPSVTINKPVAGGTTPGGLPVYYTNYMAIGSATTAGAADGTLYLIGQDNSYPQRLFEQFSTVTGNQSAKGPFIQPWMVSNEGYPTLKLVIGTIMDTCQGTSSLGPVTDSGKVNAANGNLYTSPANNGQINNIAVPEIRVADYDVAGYASLNPLAARFYNNANGTPMDELSHTINNLYPTFFTFWLGEYDVLGYALAGGQGDGNITGPYVAVPLFLNFYNKSDITPLSVFETLYDSALHLAWSIGSSGALINIPDYTTAPFFTTIPANGLFLTRQSQADSLNAYWAAQNKFPFVLFHIGYNYFIIQDNSGNVRQAVPGEEILLSTPMANITCYGWGSYSAIPAQYVLTTDELQFIRSATKAFNDFIYQESLKYHLAYVDMNTYLNTLATGIAYNGIQYSASYVSGGAYSLDGITFTPRGYALVSNAIISSINSYYHSTIPLTNANLYNGILFP